MVVVRAFTTCQSANAHKELFLRVNKIVMEDTGNSLRFKYLHGIGLVTVLLDQHRGQALGLDHFMR